MYVAVEGVLPGFLDVLAEGDQEDVQSYLRSFNDFNGYIIGFVLQFIQIISIFLPSVPIQVAVGLIFGTWRGFLICYAGYVAANAVVFTLYRRLGKGLDRMFPNSNVKIKKDRHDFILGAEHPAFMVFLASILPVIPNGVIPYIAAKTKMSFRSFIVAVATGCVPTILTLCAIGGKLTQGNWWSALVYTLPLILFVAIMFWQQKNAIKLYEYVLRRVKRNKPKQEQEKSIAVEDKI